MPSSHAMPNFTMAGSPLNCVNAASASSIPGPLQFYVPPSPSPGHDIVSNAAAAAAPDPSSFCLLDSELCAVCCVEKQSSFAKKNLAHRSLEGTSLLCDGQGAPQWLFNSRKSSCWRARAHGKQCSLELKCSICIEIASKRVGCHVWKFSSGRGRQRLGGWEDETRVKRGRERQPANCVSNPSEMHFQFQGREFAQFYLLNMLFIGKCRKPQWNAIYWHQHVPSWSFSCGV